jgi:Protein of unknown function (DUF3253)
VRSATDELLHQKIIDLLKARKPESSICPSDAPRALFTEWREHMPSVRRVALEMAQAGTLTITQVGVAVDLEKFASGGITGPIRLRLTPIPKA